MEPLPYCNSSLSNSNFQFLLISIQLFSFYLEKKFDGQVLKQASKSVAYIKAKFFETILRFGERADSKCGLITYIILKRVSYTCSLFSGAYYCELLARSITCVALNTRADYLHSWVRRVGKKVNCFHDGIVTKYSRNATVRHTSWSRPAWKISIRIIKIGRVYAT